MNLIEFADKHIIFSFIVIYCVLVVIENAIGYMCGAKMKDDDDDDEDVKTFRCAFKNKSQLTVRHGLGDKFPIISVYGEHHNLIMGVPAEYIDDDTLVLRFGALTTGYVIITSNK